MRIAVRPRSESALAGPGSAFTASPQFTDAQLVALGGAVKSKALTDAKGRLPQLHNEAVDFRVRIHGNISKGVGVPASTGTMPASFDLFNRNVVSQLLKQLKVEPKKLRSMLRKIADDRHEIPHLGEHPANAELLTIFNEVSHEVAATLPPVPTSSNGRAGTVSTNVNYELL